MTRSVRRLACLLVTLAALSPALCAAVTSGSGGLGASGCPCAARDAGCGGESSPALASCCCARDPVAPAPEPAPRQVPELGSAPAATPPCAVRAAVMPPQRATRRPCPRGQAAPIFRWNCTSLL